MSSTDEPTAMPDEIIEPTASYEVIQESYQVPTASFEPIKADSSPRPSTETIQFSENPRPFPTVDYMQKNAKSEN